MRRKLVREIKIKEKSGSGLEFRSLCLSEEEGQLPVLRGKVVNKKNCQ